MVAETVPVIAIAKEKHVALTAEKARRAKFESRMESGDFLDGQAVYDRALGALLDNPTLDNLDLARQVALDISSPVIIGTMVDSSSLFKRYIERTVSPAEFMNVMDRVAGIRIGFTETEDFDAAQEIKSFETTVLSKRDSLSRDLHQQVNAADDYYLVTGDPSKFDQIDYVSHQEAVADLGRKVESFLNSLSDLEGSSDDVSKALRQAMQPKPQVSGPENYRIDTKPPPRSSSTGGANLTS